MVLLLLVEKGDALNLISNSPTLPPLAFFSLHPPLPIQVMFRLGFPEGSPQDLG